MDLDPVLLARLQFAFTITFHIIFPSFTIGLSAFIATLLVRWIATGREHLHRLARFWTKIFAVSFAMGVVSGIVLSYQFGTNWSRFSVVVGNVIGPLIGYEVLMAFFLEATFLGIMLFGWTRVPPWLRVFRHRGGSRHGVSAFRSVREQLDADAGRSRAARSARLSLDQLVIFFRHTCPPHMPPPPATSHHWWCWRWARAISSPADIPRKAAP
jgi:hypothetical protein